GDVTAACALLGMMTQRAYLVVAITWKFVAEIGQREIQARGEFGGVGDRVGDIGEQPRHLRRRLPPQPRRSLAPTARFGDFDLVPDAGQDIEQLALIRVGVSRRVSREQGDAESARFLYGGLVARLLPAIHVALELRVDIARSEDIAQALQAGAWGKTHQ